MGHKFWRVLFVFSFISVVLAQEPIEKDNIRTTQAHFNLGDFEVIVLQNKPVNLVAPSWPKEGVPKYCDAYIEVHSGSQTTGIEKFENILPYGDNYGIFFPKAQESIRHVILIKRGDYDSRTIVIDDTGHIHNLKGGRFRIFHQRYLISPHDEDGHTGYFTIFDLYENKILFTTSGELKVSNFYTDGQNLYVKRHRFHYISLELTNRVEYYDRIDFETGDLVATSFDENQLEEIVIDLSNLDMTADCECKKARKVDKSPDTLPE